MKGNPPVLVHHHGEGQVSLVLHEALETLIEVVDVGKFEAEFQDLADFLPQFSRQNLCLDLQGSGHLRGEGLEL